MTGYYGGLVSLASFTARFSNFGDGRPTLSVFFSAIYRSQPFGEGLFFRTIIFFFVFGFLSMKSSGNPKRSLGVFEFFPKTFSS